MKNLLTPKTGSSRYFAGRLLTGGRHYVLVSEADSFAKRQVLLGDVELLEGTDGKAVTLPDSASDVELKNILADYMTTNPWVAEESTYEEYVADCYRFSAAAYSSELNGETEESEEEKRAAEAAALAAAEAEKEAAALAAAEAEKEAAEKAAQEAAQEAADKEAAEKALADEKEAAEKEAAEKAAAAEKTVAAKASKAAK